MKKLIHIPILILVIGIAACSPVTASMESHTLGETLGQSATTVDVDAEADAEAEVDAESKADAEELPPMTPAQEATPETTSEQDTTLRLPVAKGVPVVDPPSASAGDQDTAPEQEKEPALEQHVEPLPTMPIITETHQGFTYRPGQVVATWCW